LGHPTIGLVNSVASGSRLFGWLFYFFYEGYSPFVVSLLWAFANSITDPGFARQGYAIMAAGGKFGGMISALVGWYIFSCSTGHLFLSNDVVRHQSIVVYSSLLLLVLPLIVFILMRTVPDKYLHGYEAAYQFEKEHKGESVGLLGGLRMLIKQPYVMGIFGMIFFYEIINVVLNYQRIVAARCASESVSALSCLLFQQIFFVNLSSFLLSFFGTNSLVRLFGVRRCMLFVPCATGLILLVYLIKHDLTTLTIVFTLIRGINYGIMYPIRESLYIPTTKDIKFKSKSWIDSFGSKLSKATGSSLNWLIPILKNTFGQTAIMLVQVPLFAIITGAWFITAYLLGKRYSLAISRNEVIGVQNTDLKN
jgi:AAA family ATP:ADP antiporter